MLGFCVRITYNAIIYCIAPASAMDETFAKLIKDRGLTEPKWTNLFIKEGITNSDQIPKKWDTEKVYGRLSSHANEREKEALQQLFGLHLDEDLVPGGQDWDIGGKLQKLGLDPKYWLPIFSKQLGVTSLPALEFIGMESLPSLEPFTRQQSERKALRKLISFDLKECPFEILREKQRAKLIKRQEQAQQLLHQLSRLLKDCKDHHDIKVQHYEQGIREMLQVSQAIWSSNQDLEQLISRLQKNFKQISIELDTEELTGISLLQTASGGLCLQGILLSTKLQEHLQDRSRLLRAPKNVQLSITDHSQSERNLQFFDENKQSLFQRSVSKLGYSAIVSQPVCELYQPTKPTEEGKYSSSVKYYSIPVASYFFTDDDLQLSEEATDQLQDIELAIKTKDNLQELCEKFLNTFGSHAYKGPLTFGGIYWQKWLVQKEKLSMEEQNGEGAICGDTGSQQTCEVSLTGGPENISDLPEWKTGLIASNTTWKLIDRGSTLVPVWKIIEMNHEGQFDKSELAHALHNAWKTMINISNENQLPMCHLIDTSCCIQDGFRSEFLQPLMDCINASIESIKCAQETSNHEHITVTSAVTKKIQCAHRLKFDHVYEILLLDTLIYPLKLKDDLTLKMLSLRDLEYLGKYIEDESEALFAVKQKNLAELKAQVYLFKLAIDIYLSQSEVDMNEAQILKHFEHAKVELGDKLEAPIAHILTEFFQDHNYDWRILKSELEVLSQKLQLFERLQLDWWYLNKMSLKDVLLVRKETLDGKKCTKLEQLPLFILQKIMAFDYRCRTNLYHMQSQNPDSEEESDFEDDTNVAEHPPVIHPMDSFLALIHCSNDFLRQDLMARLSTCQLSIPLILPDPFSNNKVKFSLWALKSIIKEWKSRQVDGSVIERECPIVSYKAPIVSFLRLGEHSKSKSSILNQVISSDSHDIFNHFFHRDCEGGHSKRLLGGGLVEMCWYLPAGKQDDVFPDVVTFLNLRGDAKDYPQQTAFLCEMSFMSFILLSEKNLDEKGISFLNNLSLMPGGLVLLFDSMEGKQPKEKIKQIPQQVQSIKMMNKNPPAVKNAIQRKLKKMLEDNWVDSKDKMKKLTECNGLARKYDFYTDDDNTDLVEGQKNANDLLKLIIDFSKKNPGVSVKEKMLPLQGNNLWHEWVKLDREEHRQISREEETVEDYSATIQHKKKDIRSQQIERLQDLEASSVINNFISAISTKSGDVRRYFLQCLKLGLNELSRDEITELRHEYNKKKIELFELQDYSTNKQDNHESEVQKCKKEIEAFHDKLINASFGVEHLLREVGQVYEAVAQSSYFKENLKQYEHLPGVVAELLIDGYQIELMDGDTAHIPLTWIIAVLHELSFKLEDPRIFVLSVLGLQSTGKSTLMNTTFGLQFNVSAGRCTRGAFIQLLPIDKTLSGEVNCNYVLVVDTEGLRGPSLTTSQEHDNQLATFVIGLANVTMINIFGETPGDIDDILQTAVHAFLRMKHVKLALSCQFVHQNVISITASSKGGIGRYKFKEKLDEMTCEAAKAESCEGQYKYFNDIIKFDDRRDVHYFPSLLRGDPPMAPINHGYSERAQGLKLKIIDLVKSLGSNQVVSLFQLRIQDLWDALLKENFVFSFKNTMEIIAYNTLDGKWSQWAWEFQNKVLKWEHTVQNEIYSSDVGELTALYEKYQGALPIMIGETVKVLEKKMEEFIKKDKYNNILIQWHQHFRHRLTHLSSELRNHAENHYRQLKSIQEALVEVESQTKYYREILLSRVKQLASISAKELSEEQLRRNFDEHWIKWKQEIQPISLKQLTTNPDEIKSSVQKSLTAFHKTKANNNMMRKLSEKPLIEWGMELQLDVKKFGLSRNWFVNQVTARTPINWKPLIVEAQTITNNALCRAQKYLEEKRNQKFNSIYTDELLNCVFDSKSLASENLVFKSEYRIELSLVVCGYAVRQFIEMDTNFWRQSVPMEYSEQEMCEHLFSLFKNQCRKTALEKATAETFCELLTKPIERQVIDSLSGEIVNNMMMGSHRYLHTKSAVKAKILIDLAEDYQAKMDFSSYALYLADTQRSIHQWIKFYTKQHCQSSCEDDIKSRLIVSLANAKLSHLVFFISRKVEEASRKLRAPKDKSNEESDAPTKDEVSIKVWLETFCTDDELKKRLKFDMKAFQDIWEIQESELMDMANFTEEVQKGLDSLKMKLMDRFKDMTVDSMDNWNERPYDIIYENLRGCSEQCPFCKEQCECTYDRHSGYHVVQQHRPQCLGGYRWVASQKMMTDTCSTLVTSGHTFKMKSDSNEKLLPYKKYQQKYPRWFIRGDFSLSTSIYWKWFVAHHMDVIAEHFNAKPATVIPSSWRALEWENVKEEVEKQYYLA